MVTTRLLNVVPLLFVASLFACEGGLETDDKDSGADSAPPVDTLPGDSEGDSDDTEDSEDTGLPETTEPGTLTGMIYFDLYTTDSSGATVPLVWADWYGEDFPFGSVFVTGYTVDDDGETTYWATTLLGHASPDGEPYELEFGFDAETEVYIQATLDYWGDGLLAPYEPSTIYSAAVPVSPESALSGINLTLDVPYYDFSLSGGYWDPNLWILLSGTATISEQLADGTCMAMVYDTSDYGPYGYTGFDPEESGPGMVGSYSLYAPKSMGAAELLGGCDTNLNGLIEPSDAWGGYTEDGDTLANITIGATDMSGYELKIPLTERSVPAVTYSGVVRLDDLTYAKVSSASSLFITSQKYRVTDSWDPDASGKTFDYVQYTGSEIGDSNSYSLQMPANTVAYLWACLDVDGNGVVNEPGEPCGQASTDGKLATGSSSRTDLNFWIHTME